MRIKSFPDAVCSNVVDAKSWPEVIFVDRGDVSGDRRTWCVGILTRGLLSNAYQIGYKCTGPFFTSARTYKTRPRAEEDHHPKNYIYIYIYVARETKQFVCTVPVRSFERSAVSHCSLFSFTKRLIYCFCAVVLFQLSLVVSRKKLKCLVPQFYTQFYTNHT